MFKEVDFTSINKIIMWKFIYRTEKGTGEVIITENDLMEAVIKYQDNFEFDILTITKEEASIL